MKGDIEIAALIIAASIVLHGCSGKALAETVELPIQATIIQCGDRYEALGQCKAGVDACCAFAPLEELEPAAGEPDGQEVSTEPTDDGVVVNFE
jgi:hypothetical protein